jgi:cytochrome c
MRKTMLILTAAAATAHVLGGCSQRTVSYRNDVQQIIAANCNECHAPGKPGFEASGFNTTTYEGLLRGGKFGALIKPGDPFTSAFNMVIEGRVHSSIHMPHGREKLPDRDIETLKLWVQQGAKNN